MSKVKITYFDVRGRGELARLVLEAAKKDYEQVTVDFAEWPKMKPETVYGVLPAMTVDGKEFHQGNAMATYLARENGLYGSTNLEGLMIDQVVQLREDQLQQEAKFVFASEDDKANQKKKLEEETNARVFKLFTYCLKENASNSGFLIGDKLSLGDMAIYEGTQMCFQNNPKFLDDFPELKSLREKIESGPLKEYLAKRKVYNI